MYYTKQIVTTILNIRQSANEETSYVLCNVIAALLKITVISQYVMYSAKVVELYSFYWNNLIVVINEIFGIEGEDIEEVYVSIYITWCCSNKGWWSGYGHNARSKYSRSFCTTVPMT